MDHFRYERWVFAYHGCDREVRDHVLSGQGELRTSENRYDWLGRGVYFWEYGFERANEWATQQKVRGRLNEPAVLGAIIHLGNCFDLLDLRYPQILETAYPDFISALTSSGNSPPKNAPLTPDDPDFLLRDLDCAVLNWAIERFEITSNLKHHTVRGLFQEGTTAFPGSSIKRKSHIQIAVRDPACILGYFLPQ